MTINESVIKDIIEEELTRSDVNSIISDKMSSQEFKKKVKELASEVVNELFKILWQRNTLWKSSVV
jgi:diphthamide synthase (EF-2-diphthine--ammonia ligase)